MKQLFAKSAILIIFCGSLLPIGVFAQFQDTYPVLRYSVCVGTHRDLLEVIEDYQQGDATQEEYFTAKEIYVDCHNAALVQAQALLDEGIALHTSHKYSSAISKYMTLLTLFVEGDERIEKLIIQAYVQRGRQEYEMKKYLSVIELVNKAKTYHADDETNFSVFYLEAAARYGLLRREEAKKAALQAQSYAQDANDKELINRLLDHLALRLTSPTNDIIGRQQFRISAMGIDRAWKMISVPQKVTIAIIDAGIDATHPDMEGKLRTNPKEIPNNGIDDDGNGYIDDTHGRNFIDDNGDMTPYGSHGTQVAGIVGASSDNLIGIAGIVNEVALMPIIICTYKDCYNSAYMDKAVRYAVDNGADIINLSLSSKEGMFISKLTDAFSYARSKGVVVTIAAGNGKQIGEEHQGIDTTQAPLSPVCNEKFPEMIIGVGSVDKDGHPHPRANFGACIDVFAYGEGVVSTSLVGSEYGEYTIADGTSLAAPLVAGIIGLGYNKYGRLHPHIVYDALLMASKDSFGVPHADDYLRELESRRLTATEHLALRQALQKMQTILSSYSTFRRQAVTMRITQILYTLENRFRTERNRKQLARVYELQTFFEK